MYSKIYSSRLRLLSFLVKICTELSEIIKIYACIILHVPFSNVTECCSNYKNVKKYFYYLVEIRERYMDCTAILTALDDEKVNMIDDLVDVLFVNGLMEVRMVF